MASTVLPTTLPHSRSRIGMVAARISTTRLCFSSITLCAIARPNVNAVMKNRNAKAKPSR